MKRALRLLLAAALFRVSGACLRAVEKLAAIDRDVKPANTPVVTPPSDPITPEARELLADETPVGRDSVTPVEVGRRVVRG